MNYPLILEYIESIKAAEENFEQLNYLRPVLGEDGEPVMTSGNFAVVFKMKDEQTGKLHAVKCFLKEQEGREEAYRMIAEELEYVNSTFLTPIKYLDKELFVDSKNSDESEFPILLMDWVEGQTLDKYIQKYVYRYQRAENLDETTESQEKAVELLANGYELDNIAYQFSCLAIWLLQQPFAHGDLKPDNIIVKEDGTLVLVDYDGMYVPAMKGQKARELGSPDFRHPLRNENDFDEHIDDFPLSSILLSLLAIANEPSLLEKYGGDGRLLLSERDYRNIAESEVLDALRPLMADKNLTTYLSLFYLCSAQKSLFKESYHLFALPEPEKPTFMLEKENLSTEVTEEDLANAWTDEYGVKYSSDRKRLLKAPYNLHEYDIRKGTIAICYGAFEKCTMLANITIPNSVIIIGEAAFFRCESIDNISIPNSVVIIKGFAFSGCFNLTNLNIPDTVTSIGELAFNGCTSLDNMYIPHSVLSIGDGVFRGCVGLSTIIVDKNNTTYDSRESCNAIIERASNRLIAGCKNTIIPDTVSIIGARAFEKCKTLTRIHIPDSVISIESSAFDSCYSLTDINIPDSVTSIGDYAFQFCSRLANIIIPNSVTSIGDSVFFACESFTDITIPNNVKSIGELAFYGCNRLKKLSLLNGVKKIGKSAFEQCRSLTHLSFPDSIISIEQEAFSLCQNLIDIFFSNAKVEIEQEVFSGCENIEKVYIPVGTRTIFEGILPELKDKFIEKNKAGSNSSDISKDKVSDSWWADENGLPYIIDYLPNSSDKTKERNDDEINSNGEIYNERVTDEDLVNAWTDQFGAKYSLDRKRLLKGPNISSYTIIDGTLVICESAFSLHDKLIEINIPSSVIQIGEKAFWCCKKLKSVRIPQSVKVIKKETFQYCFSLTNVDIPESVKKIESGAFEDCPNIINLSFPKDADVDSTDVF